MILVKFISSIGIFLSCAILGQLYGGKYSTRLQNLIYLEQCIKILETEIVFGATPMPDALHNVFKKGNSKVSFVFEAIKEDLIVNKPNNLISSFISVENMLYSKLSLKKEDVEMFLSLGRVLGTSDRNDQQKNFQLTLNQINSLIYEAKDEKYKNEKLYKSLGVISGIGLIILLI